MIEEAIWFCSEQDGVQFCQGVDVPSIHSFIRWSDREIAIEGFE